MRVYLKNRLNYIQPSKIDYANGIFVSKSGNDANPGTYALPVLTLDRANTLATTGKKIYVYPGTYVENNATEGCWVVSKTTTWYAIGEVIVKSASGSHTLYFKTANGSSVKGFTIDAEAKRWTVYFGTNDNTVHRCTIKNGDDTIQVAANKTGNKVDTCIIDGSSGTQAVVVAYSGITVTDCIFKNISTPALLDSLNHTAPVTFSNNLATENITSNGYVLYLRTDSVFNISGNVITMGANCNSILFLSEANSTGSLNVRNNSFITSYLTTVAPIYLGAASQTMPINIESNTVHALNASQTASIITIANKSDVVIKSNYLKNVANIISISVTSTGTNTLRTVIKNNLIENPATSNYIIRVGTETTGSYDNKCANTVIENNWIYGKRYYTPAQVSYDVHCIFVGHNTGSQIRYNHVYGGGLGIIIKSSGLTDPTAVIMYNVVTNCKQGIRLKGVPDVKIIGNTVYADNIDNHTGIYIDNNLGADHSTGVTVKNNIIYTTSTVTTNIHIYVATGSETGVNIDYNCLKADGAASIGNIAGTAYATHALLVAAGYNLNGLADNPKITNADEYDFTLLSDSPCIDAGETLDAALDDGQGYANASLSDVVTKQQAGIWDVGAYVY